MKEYRSVMVAVDFSELGDFAAQRAVELAGFYRARLIFLHVIEHFPEHLPHYQMSGEGEGMDPEEFLVDRAKKDREKLCDKLGCSDADKAVRITRHSAKGELLKFVEENDIDLIVMGSRGRHRLNELLAGSTATGVVRSANCDVFTVRRIE